MANSKKIVKRVGNIDEIRSKLKKKKLPKKFKLSQESTITDVKLFLDSHLTMLSTDELTRMHRPYYSRLKKVLDKLKIDIEIIEVEL